MDISELPIAFLYVIYIAIYFWVIRSFTDLGVVGRYLAPSFACCGSLYIIWGAIQKDMFLHFVVVTFVIAVSGYLLRNSSRQAPAR